MGCCETMTDLPPKLLDLGDIQATALRPRPAPYQGQYVVIRIDDAAQGREMIRRLIPHVAPASRWWEPKLPGWLGIVITFAGMKALGLPQESLDSFPSEFKQGMAARSDVLHDTGLNAPENWEAPFGTDAVHIALAIYAKDDETLAQVLELAREAHRELPGIEVIYRLNFAELPEGRNPFGYRDGLHNPIVEGSRPEDAESSTPITAAGASVKAGEFILGYEDQLADCAQKPVPEALRFNGTFAVFRKFHTDVAAFRRFLRDNSGSPEEEELLAAKMVGRWRSGAPLVLAPEMDDPELGANNVANDQFGYSDDMQGLRCPMGAHIRRVNPRDALKDDIVDVNVHKFIRRGTNFGAPLPDGVYDDDGQERGGVFLFIGAHIGRQFEFVQSQWIANGDFISLGEEQDPMVGNCHRDSVFTIPKKPLRRRLRGLSSFVILRGGEYCFMPGINGLRWIASLKT
jgi:Dyp-type peroxidase family